MVPPPPGCSSAVRHSYRTEVIPVALFRTHRYTALAKFHKVGGLAEPDVQRASQALQDAGCFAVVLECLPPVVAAAATSQLDIPTIGIGAGPHCSGQARRVLLIPLHCCWFPASACQGMAAVHCLIRSSSRTTLACTRQTCGVPGAQLCSAV